MIERIEAVAIRLAGTTWTVPRPGRHHDVFARIAIERPELSRIGGEQGFLTSTGRFVDRAEARKIAEAAGQIIASRVDAQGVLYKFDHYHLFSEDVW